MKDLDDKEVPMTHDGYLKLYQLSRPVLSGFDCLLIDEAQDCTPAASDILLRQSCAKILVGDPHQQIYAFRGARNALQEVQGTHTFYLTLSFRFGPEIAYLASHALDVLKNIRDKTILGTTNNDSVLGEKSGQLCVITRTNYELFNEVVSVCSSQGNIKIGFVGGVQSLALDKLADIYKLFKAGTNISNRLELTDPVIQKFQSFNELKKYARIAPDIEMLGKIKMSCSPRLTRLKDSSFRLFDLQMTIYPAQRLTVFHPEMTCYSVQRLTLFDSQRTFHLKRRLGVQK